MRSRDSRPETRFDSFEEGGSNPIFPDPGHYASYARCVNSERISNLVTTRLKGRIQVGSSYGIGMLARDFSRCLAALLSELPRAVPGPPVRKASGQVR